MPASSLQTNLRRDVDGSTTNTSKYLRDNNLRGGGSGSSEGDHESISEDVEGDTGHHPPFVMTSILDYQRDNDGDRGGGEGEGVGDVTCLRDGVVADNLEPGVEVCSGEVVDEEIEEPKSAGTTDSIQSQWTFRQLAKWGRMIYVGSDINLKLIMGFAQSFFVISHPTKIANTTTPKTIRQIVLADFHGQVPTVPVKVNGTSSIISPAVNNTKPIKSNSAAVSLMT